LLNEYKDKPLVDKHNMFQHLMDYWNDVMKDDVYLLVEDGWTAKTKRVLEKNQKGKEVDKGWTCDLIPKQLVIDKYLASEQTELNDLMAKLENTQAEITTYQEEYSGDEGLLSDASNDKGNITKTTLTKYIKEIKDDSAEKEALALANALLKLFIEEAALKKQVKAKETELDDLTLKQFGLLTEAEVRTLVVDDKWIASLSVLMQSEIDAISQRLTGRIKELADRYENTLGELNNSTKTLEETVNTHLGKMGLAWS
jgi:type I restriction enzyme M protein